MSTDWRKAHEDRVERFGNYCEICGQPGYPDRPLIGHHVAHKKFQKANGLEVWQLLELRHKNCEESMHIHFPPNGNTPARQREINAIVEQLLKEKATP